MVLRFITEYICTKCNKPQSSARNLERCIFCRENLQEIAITEFTIELGEQFVGKPKVNHWKPLHEYPFQHQNNWTLREVRIWYFLEWKPNIPPYGCKCQENWQILEKQHPPDFSSPENFFRWGWARHNDVSRLHSKKPTITFEEAYKLWKDSLPSTRCNLQVPIKKVNGEME